MKVFLIERADKLSWSEDYAMVVIAEDSLRAERLARWKSYDFKKAKLKATEIDMCKEQVVLTANTGG